MGNLFARRTSPTAEEQQQRLRVHCENKTACETALMAAIQQNDIGTLYHVCQAAQSAQTPGLFDIAAPMQVPGASTISNKAVTPLQYAITLGRAEALEALLSCTDTDNRQRMRYSGLFSDFLLRTQQALDALSDPSDASLLDNEFSKRLGMLRLLLRVYDPWSSKYDPDRDILVFGIQNAWQTNSGLYTYKDYARLLLNSMRQQPLDDGGGGGDQRRLALDRAYKASQDEVAGIKALLLAADPDSDRYRALAENYERMSSVSTAFYQQLQSGGRRTTRQ